MKSMWHTCLVLSSEGDSDSKQKVVRVQLLRKHGTLDPPGNKFDPASVVKEPVRQTNEVCQI